MADNHFDMVMVWDHLGSSIRIKPFGTAQVLDPATNAPVTVVQNGQSSSVVTADGTGRAAFVAQQGLLKLVSGGLVQLITSPEAATQGAANAAAAQAAQAAAEAAAKTAQSSGGSTNASLLTSGTVDPARLPDLSGTYAAASALAGKVDKGSQIINVKDYGAKGNGATDDTTALQNALNAAAAVSTFGVVGIAHVPPGRYVTTGITIPSGVTLRGSGKGVSTLVQSGAPQFLVQLRGSLTAGVTTLTANATVGAQSLTVDSTSGIVAGDLIALHDNVSYNPNDATYKSGEMLRVKSVNSGTALSVWGVVRGSWATADGSYTTGNATTVSKITPVTGGMDSIGLEGDQSSLTSLFIAQYVDRLDLRNVNAVKGGNQGLRIDGCRNVTISNYTCSDLIDDAPNQHVGYGIALSGPCQGVTITGGAISRVRHAITTIGSAYGMPHQVTMTGTVVMETTDSALDTHAAGEGILFSGCVVTGCSNGVNIRSRNTHVKGCVIDQAVNHGVNFNETQCKDVSVQGTTISRNVSGYGIVAAYPVDGLVLLDNTLRSVPNHAVVLDSGSSRVRVGRNVILDYGTTASGRVGIFSNTTNGGTPATTGWDVFSNLIGQAAVTTAANAINVLSASLTGARAYDNRAFGTFSSTVFNSGAATSSRNVKVDAAAPSITGSRGGNAAVASLLTQLAAQGLITDGTTA